MQWPGNPMQMSCNPMFPFFGANPNPMMGSMMGSMMFPNQNVMGGNWSAMYNPININNMNNNNINDNNMNNNSAPQIPGKMNIVFKKTDGIIKIIQVDIGTTVGQLIALYLKRMDRENLIGNDKDFFFLYDAAKLKFDDNRRIEQVFRFVNPTILVNDVHNLIGAY